jgi:hypothetical protein
MCRFLVSLLALAPLLGACAAVMAVPLVGAMYIQGSGPTPEQTEEQLAQLDAKLTGMAGASERQLVGAMGRTPDSTYRLDDQTKVMQWYWDSPSCSPGARHWAPRQIVWVNGNSPSPERDTCLVQWTVWQGISQWYRWQGYGCGSLTLAVP